MSTSTELATAPKSNTSDSKDSHLLSIKLNGPNFAVWYHLMKILLEDLSLNSKEPANEGECPFVVTESVKVLSVIFKNISNDLIYKFTKFEKATKLWNHLYKTYSGSNEVRKQKGIHSICNLKWIPGGVNANIHAVNTIVAETIIANGGDTISITQLGIYSFLSSAPERFSTIRAIIVTNRKSLKIWTKSKSCLNPKSSNRHFEIRPLQHSLNLQTNAHMVVHVDQNVGFVILPCIPQMPLVVIVNNWVILLPVPRNVNNMIRRNGKPTQTTRNAVSLSRTSPTIRMNIPRCPQNPNSQMVLKDLLLQTMVQLTYVNA
jgi:hypothetical protein